MKTSEFLLLLEAAVDNYNAGGSGDWLAGTITDLVTEARATEPGDAPAEDDALLDAILEGA